jgi:hypothetical protein
MEAAISAFEKTAGVEFPKACEWLRDVSDHEAFGSAVRQVLAGKDGAIVKRLLSIRDKARELADEVDKNLSEGDVPVPVPAESVGQGGA